MTKINLGCGNVPLIGYRNVDKYYYPGSSAPLLDYGLAGRWNNEHPDSTWEYGDIAYLSDIPSDSFEEVIMVHSLEHLSMDEGNRAIAEAYRICAPGGTVEIEVPDLIKACQAIQTVEVNTQPWYRIMGCLYGTSGMDGEGQFHLCGYSKDYLMFKMKERGFKDIGEIPVGFGHGNNQEGHPEPEYDLRMRGVK